MTTYYAIEIKAGRERYICETCANTECIAGAGYRKISHAHDLVTVTEIGTWCDSCNAPLDTPNDYERDIVTVVFAPGGYTSAPLRFESCDQRRIAEIVAEIAEYSDSAISTEWSQHATDTDRRGAKWAQQQEDVLIAQDEDGYYFARVEK